MGIIVFNVNIRPTIYWGSESLRLCLYVSYWLITNPQATNGSEPNLTARERQMDGTARSRFGLLFLFPHFPFSIFHFQLFAPSLPVGAVIGTGLSCWQCSNLVPVSWCKISPDRPQTGFSPPLKTPASAPSRVHNNGSTRRRSLRCTPKPLRREYRSRRSATEPPRVSAS